MVAYAKTTRGRGRPLTDRRMYYSPDHRYALAFCAKQANRMLWYEHRWHVDSEELMAEGWWRCLRRLTPDQLRQGMRHTILAMVKYAVEFYRLEKAV